MLNIAAAVSVRAVPSFGTGNAFSPAYPLSFTFSAPTAIAMSYAPDATAYAAWRSASEPVAQKFSTRVTGLPSSCNGRASVMPLMPLCAVPNQYASTVVLVDARVVERLVRRVDEQVVEAGVEPLTERRAPHADDRDAVLDPVRAHAGPPVVEARTGRAFQK